MLELLALAIIAILGAFMICSAAFIALTAISNALCWLGALFEHYSERFANRHDLRRLKDRALDVSLDVLGLCGAAVLLFMAFVVFAVVLLTVGPVYLAGSFLICRKKK